MTPPTFETMLKLFEIIVKNGDEAEVVEARATVIKYVQHLEKLSNGSISHMNFITDRR